MSSQKLFGTSGIRGDEEKVFTNQFCFDIGLTFAKFLDGLDQKGPVAIGMDPRGSSPRISNAIQQGLIQGGREVFNQGASPGPAINNLLLATDYAGGVMVTGSHIAAGLNGVKLFVFNGEILREHEQQIENIYEQVKEKTIFPEATNAASQENRADEEYEEKLVSLGIDYPDWRVVVDPGNGAQSDLMPRVLSRLGMKVVAINDELQGGFIARDTETEDPLRQLQSRVVSEKADFGVAYDCDGDRAAFVDSKGKFVPGDYIGALLSKYGDTKTIVTPISTSQVVELLGKPVRRTRVGSPEVIRAMKETGASFGFEANGGCISAEVMMSRDGGSTTIKVLNLMATLKKDLIQLVNQLPQFALYRLKIACPSPLNRSIIEAARKAFVGERMDETDGLKIWLDQTTWLLFRPSGNAPEFRVFAESKEKKQSKDLAEKGMNLVKKVVAKAKNEKP